MAAKGSQSGMATEVARQASERIHGAASWLEHREPGDLFDEVRNFARRRPGAFLIRRCGRRCGGRAVDQGSGRHGTVKRTGKWRCRSERTPIVSARAAMTGPAPGAHAAPGDSGRREPHRQWPRRPNQRRVM